MKAKVLTTILVGSLAISVVSMGLAAAEPGNPGQGRKLDKEKPVPATNVKLVKKIRLRGHGGPPPHARGGKKRAGAATGVLGAPVSGPRYAVVVGISEMGLEYCDDDASAMAQALTQVYGYHGGNVTLLIDEGTTRSEILDAIEAIPPNAGEVVFFFSGHAVSGDAMDWDKEKIDEGIAVAEGNEISYIWDGELQALFDRFDTSTRVVFIFDTCLAGGMRNDLRRQGRIVVAATTEKGLAWEDDDLENGEFSYYFVDQGILEGYANIHDYDGEQAKSEKPKDIYEFFMDAIRSVMSVDRKVTTRGRKAVYGILEKTRSSSDDGGTGEPEQVTVEEAFDYAEANCVDDRPNIGDFFDDDLLL